MYIDLEIFRYEPAGWYKVYNGDPSNNRFKIFCSLVSPMEKIRFYTYELKELKGFIDFIYRNSRVVHDPNLGILITAINSHERIIRDGKRKWIKRELNLGELEDLIENLSRQRD